MRPEAIRQLRRSGVWALAAVILLSIPYAGIVAIYVLLWLCIRLPFAIYRAYKDPTQRALPWVIASVWTVALVLVAGIHFVRHEMTRGEADRVVSAIEEFHKAHGVYPNSLSEVGSDEEELQSKLGQHGYSFYDGSPHFYYGVTYVPFETWDYDFSSRQWRRDAP